jgi:hypothetical protein
MTDIETAAYVQSVVASAPPLNDHQTVTLAAIMVGVH